MTFLLDSNMASAYLKRPATLAHRFLQHSGRIALPSMALAELYAWAYAPPDPTARLGSIRQLREAVVLIPFEEIAAEVYGRLEVGLRRGGIVVDTPDLIIASVALAHDLTLVTHNVRHFQPVPGLRVEDWLDP